MDSIKHYKNLLTINLKEEGEKNKGRVLAKTPLEHQTKARKKMTDFFVDSGKRGILVLPTGAGKTYTSVSWILENIVAKKKKVLWLADQGFLLEQAREEFKQNILLVKHEQRTEINIRLVSGSSNHSDANSISITDDILLITSQTAISCWDCNDMDDNGNIIETKFQKFINANAKNNELFIVYDEAHHTPAFGRRNLLIGGSEGKKGICENYKNVCLLGLTATPSYTDKNNRGWLWQIFKDEIIHSVSKKELQDSKVLAIPSFISEKTNFKVSLSDSDIESMIIKHQELPSRIIEELAKNEERNRFIAQLYCEKESNYGKTIIFVDRWYQCKTIERYINEKAGQTIAASVFSYVDTNKNIDYINSRTKDQNDINLSDFKSGKLKVLLNVKMLTEGVDVPDVKTVFITRETNSTILFTQMVGRALRGEKAGGKKSSANIIFFIDNWNRHIQFAQSKIMGGLEDNGTKERGYRPMELINIDLIDKLKFEYENQNYETSFIDLIPIGWYVVSYSDTIIEEDEEGKSIESTQAFTENVLINKNEKIGFENFIQHFFTKHKSTVWEHDKLDSKNVEDTINNWIKEYFPELTGTNFTNALKVKLTQLARHLGRNNNEPEFFTFEQREELDLRKLVEKIREKNYSRRDEENCLENYYNASENPLLKVFFPSFDDFRKAYNLEYEVSRKSKMPKVEITGRVGNWRSGLGLAYLFLSLSSDSASRA